MTVTMLGEKKYFFNRFESLYEMGQAIRTVAPNIRRSTWVPGSGSYDSNWVGRRFNSWEEVYNATEKYWPEGMAVYHRMIGKLREAEVPPPKSLKRRAIWSEDDGDDLDLDRLQRDQPYWRTTHREHRPGPVSLTIVTDITTSGSYDAMDVLWRGAASVVLTELLEQSGYRVELWVTQHCVNSYRTAPGVSQCTAVCLKRGGDMLDVSSLINATSSWSYRILFFAAYWLGGHVPNDGLGTIADINSVVPYITPDKQVVQCKGLWGEDSSIMWIQNNLKRLKEF